MGFLLEAYGSFNTFTGSLPRRIFARSMLRSVVGICFSKEYAICIMVGGFAGVGCRLFAVFLSYHIYLFLSMCFPKPKV